ncbi:MAG: Ldh family oxidoreductase [Pseudomonadota bacterium]
MSDTINLSLSDAKALLQAAFEGAGVPPETAKSVAVALVAAEAEGQVGHGFSRLADYAAQAQSGKINATAQPEVIERGPAALHIDADRGFAYPALDAAYDAGVLRAKEMGIAVLTIGNSHHCGALSVQVDRLAEAGLIAIMAANTPKAMAPWGGAQALYGTNPIAFATPQADGPPLVIDLSLSKVARGKIMAAKKAGKPIPAGWALDAQGQPTTDPDAALAGTMVPIGEAKGTALALMVELLAAALTGSAFSAEAGSFFNADGAPPRVGQTIIAINPAAQSDYTARVSALLSDIDGMDGARLPGTRRRAALARAATHGIDVPASFVHQARTLAGQT